MAKGLVCNVESQGMMHQVTVSGNKVTVDGNAPMKIKDALPKEKRKSGSAITIPLSQMGRAWYSLQIFFYRRQFSAQRN